MDLLGKVSSAGRERLASDTGVSIFGQVTGGHVKSSASGLTAGLRPSSSV